MALYFEDSRDNAKISLLLQEYPVKSLISKDSFYDGNCNAPNVCYNCPKPAILFIDVVPDNPKSLELYNRCVDIANNEVDSILIVPIPCIEFVILSYCNKTMTNIGDLKIIRNTLRFGEYQCNYKVKSYEKYCKAVLNGSYVRECLRFNRKGDFGLYYISDCFCGRSSELCSKVTKSDKALSIVNYLLFEMYGEYTNSSSIINNAKVFYKNMFNKLSKHRNTVPFESMKWCNLSNLR